MAGNTERKECAEHFVNVTAVAELVAGMENQ